MRNFIPSIVTKMWAQMEVIRVMDRLLGQMLVYMGNISQLGLLEVKRNLQRWPVDYYLRLKRRRKSGTFLLGSLKNLLEEVSALSRERME